MTRAGLVLLAMLLASPQALAHAFLERANPPVGSELPAPPAAVSLTFTEAVEPRFSSIELRDQQGGRVAAGEIVASQGGRTLSVTVPRLAAGTYAVIWHVTSVDTHKTEGRFAFTVGR
jgi:methionine-rich copper-binding protein CopC